MTQNKTILNQNWCFRAKNRPKIAKKKKKIEKSLSSKPKLGAKMAKNKTIFSQNWSFRAKNQAKIAKKKGNY